MEPEFGAAGVVDARLEMMRVPDMTAGAGWRGESQVAHLNRVVANSHAAAVYRRHIHFGVPGTWRPQVGGDDRVVDYASG